MNFRRSASPWVCRSARRNIVRCAVGLVVFALMHSAAPALLAQQAKAEQRTASSKQPGDPRSLKDDEIRMIFDVLAKASGNSGKDINVRYVNGLEPYMRQWHREIAHELGLRAFTLDFEGGPFNCWLEIEAEGAKRRQHPDGFAWFYKAEKGRLLCWFLPDASDDNPSPRSRKVIERMKHVRFRLDRRVPEVLGIQVVGGRNTGWELTPGLGLWSTWNDVEFKEIVGPKKVRIEGETTLLEIEAVEKTPRKGQKVGKLTLRWKAKSVANEP